jgi:putative peptidoglycan lipid II flippase
VTVQEAGRRLAGAAAVVAALTVASRVVGFARVVVFNAAVGPTSLGDAYQAANQVPNIVFELVAGGALASLVVPLLAGPAARGDRRAVAATASALLTWVLAILVPVALVVALAAHPLVLLLDHSHNPAEIDAGAGMLRVFAPQLPLYGVGIVLTGVLQTYRRFAWPVIAPLLSSVTVIAVYIAFALLAGRNPALGRLSDGHLLLLSGGTTLAVAVLSLCLLVPLRRLGLPLRPTLRPHAGAIGAIRALVVAGVVTVGAQQLSLAVSIGLSSTGPEGSIVIYNLAQTIFLLPWAVLALPLATTGYPALAEAGAAGDDERYAATLAPATRSLLLLCCLGGAALVALAAPVAGILVRVMAEPPPVGRVAAGIAWFAPGLLGYGLFALLSRALYARRAAYAAAVATALGWAVAAASALLLAPSVARGDRVAALAAANSIGMTVLGLALAFVVRRRAGAAALHGFGRTITAGVTSAVLAAAAGLAVRAALWSKPPGLGGLVAQGMLCGVVVAVVFVAAAAVTDRHTLAPLIRRARRRRE